MARDPARGILASVATDGTLRIWEEETGRLVRRIAVTRGSADAVSLDLSTGLAAVSVSEGPLVHRIEVWDWERDLHLYTVTLGDAPLFVRFSRGGEYLLYGETRENTFKVLQASNGVPVPGFRGPGMTGFAVLAKDEDALITYDLSGSLTRERWSSGGTPLAIFPAAPLLSHVRLSDDGRTMVGAVSDTVVAVDVTTGRSLSRVRLPGLVSWDISRDAATIVALFDDGRLELVPVQGADGRRQLEYSRGGISRATVVRTASHGYLVGGEDGAMDMVSDDGSTRPFARDIAATVTSLAGGKGLVAASTADAVYVLAIAPESGEPVQDPSVFPNPFTSPPGVLFIDSNRLLIWGKERTGDLGIYDRTTMRFEPLGGKLASPLRSVAVTGNSIFTLGANGDITLIDTTTAAIRGTTNRWGAEALAAVSPTAVVVGYQPRGKGRGSLERVDLLTEETVAVPTRNIFTFALVSDPHRDLLYTLGIDAAGATNLEGHEGQWLERETLLQVSQQEHLGASLALDPVDGTLYSALEGGKLDAWSLSPPVVRHLADPAYGTMGQGFGDGVVATIERDSTLLVWDSVADRQICEITLFPGGRWGALLPRGSLRGSRPPLHADDLQAEGAW